MCPIRLIRLAHSVVTDKRLYYLTLNQHLRPREIEMYPQYKTGSLILVMKRDTYTLTTASFSKSGDEVIPGEKSRYIDKFY